MSRKHQHSTSILFLTLPDCGFRGRLHPRWWSRTNVHVLRNGSVVTLFSLHFLTLCIAADHALAFEVLTPSGNFVTANEVQNRDLFWALKGGGPSTFGVVLSLTVKTHAEVPTAGIILNINWTHTLDEDVFWKGVSAFHDLSNYWVDHGIFAYFELMPFRFHVQPIVGPNMTAAQLDEIAKPMFDRLNADNVPYEAVTKEYPTFYDLYIDMFEDEMSGSSVITGGRILPREDFVANATGIVDSYRSVTRDPAVFIIGHVVGPGRALPVVDNAIHPVWRNSSNFVILSYSVPTTASWDEKRAAEDRVTNVVNKALREAAPHGGAYVNEVCPFQDTCEAFVPDSFDRAISKSQTGKAPIGAQTMRGFTV